MIYLRGNFFFIEKVVPRTLFKKNFLYKKYSIK